MLSIVARLLLAAAAVAVVETIVIVIHGIITKDKIEQELRNRDMEAGLVEAIDNCHNIIPIKELGGDKKIEIQGDGISSDIKVGDVIYGHGKRTLEDYMKDLVGEAPSTITFNDLYCDNIEIQDDDDLSYLLEDDDDLSDFLEDDDDDDIISIDIY